MRKIFGLLLLVLTTNIFSGSNDLYNYAVNRDIETLKSVIKITGDINYQNSSGETLLIAATIENKISHVKWLIDNGADLLIKDNQKKSALSYAITNNNVEIVKHIVNKGVNLEEKIYKGSRPLSLAIKSNNYDIIKILVEEGAEVEPFHLSIQKSNSSIFNVIWTSIESNEDKMDSYYVKEAIDYNMSANGTILNFLFNRNINFVKNKHIYGAISRDSLHLLKRLSENGIDLNIEGEMDGSILMHADKSLSVNTIEFLESLEVALDEADFYGETPLFKAVKYENREVINYLIKQGADINRKNVRGETLFDIALNNQGEDIYELLISKGLEDTRDSSIFRIKPGVSYFSVDVEGKRPEGKVKEGTILKSIYRFDYGRENDEKVTLLGGVSENRASGEEKELLLVNADHITRDNSLKLPKELTGNSWLHKNYYYLRGGKAYFRTEEYWKTTEGNNKKELERSYYLVTMDLHSNYLTLHNLFEGPLERSYLISDLKEEKGAYKLETTLLDSYITKMISVDKMGVIVEEQTIHGGEEVTFFLKYENFELTLYIDSLEKPIATYVEATDDLVEEFLAVGRGYTYSED